MAVKLENGTTFAGKYRIDGILGRGGMGSVFAATNLAVGRRVAVKVMDTSNLEPEQCEQLLHRFRLEAQATALIDHPGVVDVIDMGETDDGAPYIVMEYLEGATLKAVQKLLGPLTPAQAVAVLDPVLDALSAAHHARVIHRDIKPANIFLCTRPRQVIKVLDFGISRFGEGTGMTQTGLAMGTPQYMAPEQVRGEKNVGPESDLYSVGAMLYSMLSGHPPFESENDMAVLARVLTDAPPPLRELVPDAPEPLAKLTDLLLVKDRARRPNDAALLREQLLALVEPDAAGLWDAASSAVKTELAKGTPRTGSSRPGSSSSRPGVLAMPRTPSRTSSVPVVRASAPRPTSASAPTLPSKPSRMPEGRAPPPRKSGSAGLAIGVGLAVVLVAGVGVGLYLKQPDPVQVVVLPKPAPRPHQVVEAPVEPAAPEVEETVAITLSAEPASARFLVDGVAQDCNPCTLTEAPKSTHQVKIQAEHYASKEFELLFDRPRERHEALAPEAASPPSVVRKTPAPPPATKQPKKPLSVDESNPYQ